MVTIGFGGAVLVGTALLALPIATRSGHGPGFIDALFTATSAVCVTGLVTVDTGTFWSPFGQGVIVTLIQVGGLGIMTLATIIALLISRRLGLRTKLLAQAETRTLSLRDVRAVVARIALFSLISEAVVAVILTTRFAITYDEAPGRAIYDGVFHSISAFNNAGFSLNSDSLMRYVADPWISLSIAAAVIAGGLGFPVVFELVTQWSRPRDWSILTKTVVVSSTVLLVGGSAILTATEFTNPETLGPLSTPAKLLAGFFAAVMPRTAGFNSIDVSAMRPESLFATDALMFIGGGSASTAGGIKVTTLGLLAFIVWAEVRGDPSVNMGRRQVPTRNQRQALAIVLLAAGTVSSATFALLAISDHGLERILFEVISALSTVGLSTGITDDLPPVGQLILVALMFVGRIGPLTLASALALREHGRRYELPEERITVG